MNPSSNVAQFCAYCFSQSVRNSRCENPDCLRPAYDYRAHQALPPGTVLSKKYRIGKMLGAGGFGITYRAKHVAIDRFVAVKEFYPSGIARRDRDEISVVGTPGRGERALATAKDTFLKEAQTLAKLDGQKHPEIVEVFDFFEENGTAYIVMSFLDGETLAERVMEQGALEEANAVHVLRMVLRGLRVVHRAGILHRDIKPDNVFLKGHAQPVLIDFGNASADFLGKAGVGVLAGTPGYAPPEQRSGNMSESGDIYALGATLYAVLTNTEPTPADERVAGAPLNPTLESLQGQISPLLCSFLNKSLRLSAKERYQHIDEIFIELKPILEPKADWVSLLPASPLASHMAQVQIRLEGGKAYAAIWNWQPAFLSNLWFLVHRAVPVGLAVTVFEAVCVAGLAFSHTLWFLWWLPLTASRALQGMLGDWLMYRDLEVYVKQLRSTGTSSADALKRALTERVKPNALMGLLGMVLGPVLFLLIFLLAAWDMEAARSKVAADIHVGRLMCKIQDYVKERGLAPTFEDLALPPDQIGGHVAVYELEEANIVLKLKEPDAVAGHRVRLMFNPVKGQHDTCVNMDLPDTWVPDACMGNGRLPPANCGKMGVSGGIQ